MKVILNDTIAAIATPQGEGGIAVIRISGPESSALLQRIFFKRDGKARKDYASHRLYHGIIKEPKNEEIIDQVLVSFMKGPRSYTGEDTAEIYCHGGRLVSMLILEVVTDAGARMAQPGEFTRRAFLNNRIDLTQAEAVLDIINAKSRSALKSGLKQLEGGLSERFEQIKEKLIELKMRLETAIDFPEEELDDFDREAFLAVLEDVSRDTAKFLNYSEEKKGLKEGYRLVIAGPPNAGKSRLLNALLEEDRAIVHFSPGTTRDLIEEERMIGGVLFRLIDTAGLRKNALEVEAEGINRSRKRIREADLLFFVLDASLALREDDLEIITNIEGPDVFLVCNKKDLEMKLDVSLLGDRFPSFPLFIISALTGAGVEDLRKAAVMWVRQKAESSESDILAGVRHRKLLKEILENLARAGKRVEEGSSPEFPAADIMAALDAVGEVTGEATPDDVLDLIFSRFCIGK